MGEGSASHVHTACTLTMEEGSPDVDACDLQVGAFHVQGVVHTCADGVVVDSMPPASENRLTVGVQGVHMTL